MLHRLGRCVCSTELVLLLLRTRTDKRRKEALAGNLFFHNVHCMRHYKFPKFDLMSEA